MSLSPCDICAAPTEASALLFSDQGRICGSCELALGEAESTQAKHRAGAFSGPIMAFTAFIFTVGSLSSVLGLFSSMVGMFAAVTAIALGMRAFLGMAEVTGSERTLLLVCGGIAVPAGAICFASSGLMLVSHLVVLSRGY